MISPALQISQSLLRSNVFSYDAEDEDPMSFIPATKQVIEEAAPEDRRKILTAMVQSIRTGQTVSMNLGGTIHDFTTPPGTLPEVKAMNKRIYELMLWADGPMVVEKPQSSRVHDLLEAMKDGRRYFSFSGTRPHAVPDKKTSAALDFFASSPQLYLVQSDWAAALGPAIDGGEVRMPSSELNVEIQVSGRRIVGLVVDEDVSKRPGFEMILFMEFEPKMWTVAGVFTSPDGSEWAWNLHSDQTRTIRGTIPAMLSVGNFIGRQLKAICVALDAEVVETEVVRAPYKLNQAREKRGALPIRDYHVVKLARRHRATRSEERALEEKRRSPRLHFRRGHWRHYDNVKTWIKWMLVGDPDLGWIEKEYRL